MTTLCQTLMVPNPGPRQLKMFLVVRTIVVSKNLNKFLDIDPDVLLPRMRERSFEYKLKIENS